MLRICCISHDPNLAARCDLEDKRERLIACVTGSAPWRPVLRRSHSRTHRILCIRALRGRSVETRPKPLEVALLTQRGFVQPRSIIAADPVFWDFFRRSADRPN